MQSRAWRGSYYHHLCPPLALPCPSSLSDRPAGCGAAYSAGGGTARPPQDHRGHQHRRDVAHPRGRGLRRGQLLREAAVLQPAAGPRVAAHSAHIKGGWAPTPKVGPVWVPMEGGSMEDDGATGGLANVYTSPGVLRPPLQIHLHAFVLRPPLPHRPLRLNVPGGRAVCAPANASA